MKERSFSLRPFPLAGAPPPLEIVGGVTRSSDSFAISYVLRGAVAELAIPSPADSPGRRDGLWEETCFELFIAPEGEASYWELNLSPAGHWNVYRFGDYRQGMEEETAFASLPFKVTNGPDSLRLDLVLDLSGVVQKRRVLDVGVCAVLKHADGTASYWALAHCVPKPDFHRRDAFILKMDGMDGD